MSSDDENAGTERVAIGISFGNSYSSIACVLSGDAQVIANEEGDRQIPSILSYVDGEEFQGTQAKNQIVRNAANTVAGFRDFLGYSFDQIDPTPTSLSCKPQAHDSTIAFPIHDKPPSSLDTSETTPSNLVTVQDITTRHLRRLAASASDYLGRRATSAVLAIPTSSTPTHRAALTSAARAAGLEILQLIHEPCAALLAHDRRLAATAPYTGLPLDKTCVIADLGGTRSDAAVVSVRGGMYTLLSSSHDYGLGGAQLDALLAKHFAKEFLKKNKGAPDPRENHRSAAKLRLEAEAVKKSLSLGSTAAFNVESLAGGLDFSATINRTRYEMLAAGVFGRFTRLVEGCVKEAGLDILDVDEVVLCGGTAHTPRITRNLGGIFKEVVGGSGGGGSPSELIARGAALQAELVEGFEGEEVEAATREEVTVTPHLGRCIGLVVVVAPAQNPTSAGEAIPGTNGEKPGAPREQQEIFRPLIPAETPLPVRRTLTFTLSPPPTPKEPQAPQSTILLRICEGESEIRTIPPPPKPAKSPKPENAGEGDDEDEDSDSSEEEEDEPTREKSWKIGEVLGELAVRDVKPGGTRVTTQVQVGADLEVVVSAQVVGGGGAGRTGVRGVLPGIAGGGDKGEAGVNGAAR